MGRGGGRGCAVPLTAGVWQWLNPRGFRELLALLGTNGAGVGTSALAVYDKKAGGGWGGRYGGAARPLPAAL